MYSTNKVKKTSRFAHAYLINFAHDIRGSVYICMCNCKLTLQNSCVPLNNILFDFSLCQIHIREKCPKGVVANKIHGNLYIENLQGGNVRGFYLYSSTNHQREHISENTFIGPPFFVLKFLTICSWGCFQRCYVKNTQATW